MNTSNSSKSVQDQIARADIVSLEYDEEKDSNHVHVNPYEDTHVEK
jgi:hypothetical protein